MPRSFLVKKKEKGADKSSVEFPHEDMIQQEAFDLSIHSESKDVYDYDTPGKQLQTNGIRSVPYFPQTFLLEKPQPEMIWFGKDIADDSHGGFVDPAELSYGESALNLVKKQTKSYSLQTLDHPTTHSVTPFTIEALAISSRQEEKVKMSPEAGINRVAKYHDLTDGTLMAASKTTSPLKSLDGAPCGQNNPEVRTVSYTYDAFFVTDGRSKKRKEPGIALKPRNQYICNQCGKQYATSSNLSRHKQTHRSLDSQQAKQCPHCDKVYVSMPALSMHILTHKLRHVCTVCNKSFSRPWLLQGHMRSHTGEKPYGCAHCGKAFADRSNLRAHMQTHSGCKQFECKRCNKTFALKSYLNKHNESACSKE